MTLFRVVVFHLRRIFDRANVEREVDLEFRDHIERETKANMARGISERAARRAALIVFGGVQQYKEDVRDTRPLRRLEQLGQDVRFALRTLRRAPGFSAVAILTIALGVGATSAVFTVVNDVLLRPLPFEQADHLYLLSYLPPGFFGGAALGVADRLCLAFEREQRSFASTSCYQRAQFTITGAGPAERSVDTGYDASRVTTMSVDLPPTAYPTAEQVRLFHTNVLARLAGIPGVQSVGAVSWRPMADMGIMGDFRVHGATPLPKGYTVDKPAVSPGYFRAMGIRLLEGRDFTSADGPGTPGVVIVSESVARSVWPGQSAIGKRISMVDNPGAGDWLTVVGVVRDVVQDQGFARHSTVYMSYLQAKPPFFISHMSYVVRTMPGRASVAGAMRHALSGIDPCDSGGGAADDERVNVGLGGRLCVSDDPAQHILAARAAAGGDRDVRRPGVRRGGANARDRDTHGVGCAIGSRAADGDGSHAGAGRCRDCDRRHRCVRHHTRAVPIPVRHKSHRSGGIRRDGGGTGVRGARRGHAAGMAGITCRSGDRAQGGVSRAA